MVLHHTYVYLTTVSGPATLGIPKKEFTTVSELAPRPGPEPIYPTPGSRPIRSRPTRSPWVAPDARAKEDSWPPPPPPASQSLDEAIVAARNAVAAQTAQTAEAARLHRDQEASARVREQKVIGRHNEYTRNRQGADPNAYWKHNGRWECQKFLEAAKKHNLPGEPIRFASDRLPSFLSRILNPANAVTPPQMYGYRIGITQSNYYYYPHFLGPNGYDPQLEVDVYLCTDGALRVLDRAQNAMYPPMDTAGRLRPIQCGYHDSYTVANPGYDSDRANDSETIQKTFFVEQPLELRLRELATGLAKGDPRY
jgi:hypothetical protein